jgi:hypothetical protein
MTTLTRTTVLALLASFSFLALSAAPAAASHPKALLVPPHDDYDYYLPKFGFASFNISGYGERVTYVRWGGLAARLGLEPGDTVLSLNGFRLTYHGAWNDALYRAMANGGFVRLRIRDVRTGHIAHRHIDLGGFGPVTPKYYADHGPITSHVVVHDHDHDFHPHGPITLKSKVAPKTNVEKIKEIVELFD